MWLYFDCFFFFLLKRIHIFLTKKKNKIKKPINLYSPARFLRLSGVGKRRLYRLKPKASTQMPCALTGSPAIFLTKNCFKDKLYKPELIPKAVTQGSGMRPKVASMPAYGRRLSAGFRLGIQPYRRLYRLKPSYLMASTQMPCVLAGSPPIFLTKNCFKDKLYKPELIHRCISPGE